MRMSARMLATTLAAAGGLTVIDLSPGWTPGALAPGPDGAVRITLRPAGKQLVLSVRDDGIGFPDRSAQHEGRFGLLGMRERAHMLGGSFDIDNPAGGGGRVTVRLPLAAPTS